MLRAVDSPWPLLLAALAAASSLVTAQENGAASRAESGPAEKSRDDVGKFQSGSFESRSLGREVSYGVYLPPGYEQDKDRRYPVLYWLHGMFEDHARFNSRGGSKVVADLYASGKLAPMIIACADGGRRSFYANGVKSGPYEDLIVRDFISFIEDTYRTIPTRATRAIAGTSMGGSGALKIAFKHAGLFTAVATHSAALFPVNLDDLPERFRRTLDSQFGEHFKAIWGDPIDKNQWAGDNPLALASSLDAKSLDGLAIYMDCGDKDPYGFQNTHRDFHALLEKQKIPHEWNELPGGHGWGDGYLTSYLSRSLQFVSERFARVSKPGKAEKADRIESSPAR